MSEDKLTDDDKFEGRMHGEQIDPEVKETLVMRLVYMLMIALMLSVAMSVLGVLTLVQFVMLVINKGTPNPQLADFGESLGIWMAKAARFQVAASEVKPWPWTELD